jgi:hypothetical protein
VRWGKYLFIETRLVKNGFGKYVYEYQDTIGNIIIPQGKYNHLEPPDEYGFINAWKKSSEKEDTENNVGFIDIHENILIPFHYSRMFSFKHNLACARKNGKIGYINRKGEIVIPFLYNSHENFYDDGVVVIEKGRKKVLIDTLGNEIIGENHTYQEIKENFPHDHVLWIQKNKQWAFFDLKGKPLTPFIFDDMHPANICSYQPNLWYGEDLRWFYKGLVVVEKNSQFAVLNEKMEYVVPWKTYQWISPISIGGLMIVKQNDKYGLLNYLLELIQPVEFDIISNYPAEDHEQNFSSFWGKKNDKYYIFDTLGHWNDSIEYDNLKLLQANFYLVIKDGNQWRVGRNGTKVIENFTVVRAGDRRGSIARKDSLYGFVDLKGNTILPFEYEDILCEHLGNIFVKKNGKWGVMNDENQQLLPCKYDYIASAWDNSDENNYIVVQNDKFGKVMETGDELFPCMYDGITTWVEYGADGHYVRIGDKMGLINYNGEIMIPIQYEKIEYIFKTNWAIVYDKSKMGLYNIKNGSFFLPLEYDYLFIDNWFGFEKNKPMQIITYKDSIVNILDEKGKIVRSKVPKTEIEKKFEINIDAYQYSPCSYELLMMVHNRTFRVPDCLLKILKEYNVSTESIYYKMGGEE